MSNFDDMEDQFAGGGWQGKSITSEPERWLIVNQLIVEKDSEIAKLREENLRLAAVLKSVPHQDHCEFSFSELKPSATCTCIRSTFPANSATLRAELITAKDCRRHAEAELAQARAERDEAREAHQRREKAEESRDKYLIALNAANDQILRRTGERDHYKHELKSAEAEIERLKQTRAEGAKAGAVWALRKASRNFYGEPAAKIMSLLDDIIGGRVKVDL